MGAKADSTKLRIREAALAELVECGFSKFSLESVAERAGVNKNLVYRYVGDRQKTIEFAFEALLTERQAVQSRQPTTLNDAISHWIKANAGQAPFFKLVADEAFLEHVYIPEKRRAYYENQAASVSQFVETDDPSMTFLALLALTAFPFIAPNIFSLVVGPQTEVNLDRYTAAVHALLAKNDQQTPQR
jgi:TetR/AcrR family transcriptional regulator